MMQITEPSRAIDIVHQTDVLVVGSGPGGLAAALAVARAGAEGFAWYRHPATIDSEGIGPELEKRARTMGAASLEPSRPATHWMRSCSNMSPMSWWRKPGSIPCCIGSAWH